MRRTKLALVPIVLSLLAGCGTHMERALDDLRSARHQLEEAEENKGGHRVEAIAAVDAAIHQVEEGMRFAANH